MNVAPNLTSPVPSYRQRQPSYFSDRPLATSLSRSEASQPQGASSQAGLGLYPLSIPQTSQGTPLRTSSPHHVSAWSSSSAQQQSFSAPVSSQQDMYSGSPFDSYPNFSTQTTHQHQPSLSSPEAPTLEYCQSSASSDMQSHRSSVCSYTSEAAEPNMTTPRSKAEEQQSWYSAGGDHVLARPMASPGQMTFTGHGMMHSAEDPYRTPISGSEWAATDNKSFMSDTQNGGNARMPGFDVRPMLPSVSRVNKKKRQRTRPEEATHECRVCGKLFKRSYNWKSHMETHNPDRKYPHPCTATVGNQQCTKKFQRKTDLDRHFDSVHLKARNHKCHLCGNRFARRDTLRRHTEDGCPKRFELGIRDAGQVPQIATTQQQSAPPAPSAVAHMTPISRQQPSAPWFATPISMPPPIMPPHLSTGSAFSYQPMPPPALPYQA